MDLRIQDFQILLYDGSAIYISSKLLNIPGKSAIVPPGVMLSIGSDIYRDGKNS